MRLPPELNDLALDYLHDDKGALTQCALVCRDWLNAARHHLWHTIRLNLTVDEIESELLRPLARPDIAFYVRSIVITSKSLPSKVRQSSNIHILHHVLSELSLFPQLRSFALEGISFAINRCSNAECNALRLPSIRKLVLSDAAFDNLRDMQWLWCVFPNADRFHLDRVWWQHPWAGGRTDMSLVGHIGRTPSVSYKEFTLGQCGSRGTIARWLLGISPLDIQTLRLPLIGMHDDYLVDLLRGVGVSLHHLEIGALGHVKNSTHYTTFFDFSANTELKSITIGVPLYRDPDTVLEWTTTILCRIVATTVTCITFSISHIHAAHNPDTLLRAFNWPTLVSVLQSPQFALLSNIIFRLPTRAANSSKDADNFVPLQDVFPGVVVGHFDVLRRKGVDVSFEVSSQPAA